MNDKAFFDTNVILYAFRLDDTRGQVAETLLAAGGALSVQVLHEFVAVARRKLERAVQVAERYGYSIFDSLIIAAALRAGARTLYSEDMQDGQAIDGLTIRNPFSR
jgi:predicted nucleic acid-binding protein